MKHILSAGFALALALTLAVDVDVDAEAAAVAGRRVLAAVIVLLPCCMLRCVRAPPLAASFSLTHVCTPPRWLQYLHSAL